MEFKEAVEEVKGELTAYLAQNGHAPDSTGKYICPNPDHADTCPSAGIVPGNPHLIHCFGCGWSGDLFHLAEIFEKLPRNGPEFESLTLPSLCARFNIPYEPKELSEETRRRHKAMGAYQDAVHVMLSFGIDAKIAERGWSEATCRSTKTGIVPNWTDFKDKMKDKGYSASYLKEIDIDHKIFNENTVIFTWCDPYGQPKGFTARNVRYGTDPHLNRVKKFINTSAESPIYEKGAMLYGIDWARGKSPLFITEGMPDVITAYQHGFRNVVCVGGTSFTKGHIDLLINLGIDDIIFAMNDDDAGIAATTRALDAFTGRANHNIRVRVLDIGYFLFKDGEKLFKPDIDNAFKNTDKASLMFSEQNKYAEAALNWRMRHYPTEMSEEEKVDKTLDFLITYEKNNIKREQYLKELGKMVDMEDRMSAIYREFDKKTYAEDIRFKEEARKLQTEARKTSHIEDESMIIDQLASLGTAATNIRNKFSTAEHSKHETVEYIDTLRGQIAKQDGKLLGFDSGFDCINEMYMGIPTTGRMIGLAGQPSSGKTSFLHHLLLNIIERNSDAFILLFSIDDSRRTLMPRLVSILSGVPTGLILKPAELEGEDLVKVKAGWDKLTSYVKNNQLDIRDSSHGNTLDFFESWIRYAKSTYPKKKVLAILDNFHKLVGIGVDERQIYKRASERIQTLKTTLNTTFICTMELVKSYGRDPKMDDIAETKKILYDADSLLHISSDWQERLTDSSETWIDSAGITRPIVRIKTWKNKIYGVLKEMWFDMNQDTSTFYERKHSPDQNVSPSHMQALMSYAPGLNNVPRRTNNSR